MSPPQNVDSSLLDGSAGWVGGSPIGVAEGVPSRSPPRLPVSRSEAVWATGRGTVPAEALGAVSVLCLDEPLWEDEPEDGACGHAEP